jgi:hypothetical protein
MSLHFSLAAWEVKGAGAVWISDEHLSALMDRAKRDDLRLLQRIADPRADSAYASYELSRLAQEIDGMLAGWDDSEPSGPRSPGLRPSARGVRELLQQLQTAVRRAQEWQTEIVIRAD